MKYLSNQAQKKAEMKKNIKSIITIFDQILKKENFTKQDISLIIEKIFMDSDKILTIQLKSDISELINMQK